jgi:hypothetical protein
VPQRQDTLERPHVMCNTMCAHPLVRPPGVWKSWFLSIRSSHQGRELACFESAAAYHSRGAPVGVLNLDNCEIRNGVQSQVNSHAHARTHARTHKSMHTLLRT